MKNIKNFIWYLTLSIVLIGCVVIMIYQDRELNRWENFARDFYYDEFSVSPIDEQMSYENLGFKKTLFHYGKRGYAYNLWWRNENKSNEFVSLWYNVQTGVGALIIYKLDLNKTTEYKFVGEIGKFINHTYLPPLRK